MNLKFNNAIFSLLALFSLAVVNACQPEEKDPDYPALKTQFASDAFDVEAGGTISLPFAVTGVEGSELSLEASASSAEVQVSVKADIYYQGTVELVAPAVTSGEKVSVSLKVTDAAHKREASAQTTVNIGASEPLAIALKDEIRSVAVKPSGSFELRFVVSGSDNVNVSDKVDFELSSGYKADCTWDADKKGGVIKVTAPSAPGESFSMKMTITDDHSRSAELSATIKVVAVTNTAGAANCYVVKPGSTLTIQAVEGNSQDEVELDNAVLLWQDCQSLVKSVSAGDGVVVVELNPGLSGNAVVAAKKDGKIGWSWHLWVTDCDLEASAFVYTSSATNITYTMLDRNLGAMSGEKYSPDSFGLLYQWGRKDPFIGGNGVLSLAPVKIYDIDNKEIYHETEQRPTYDDKTSTNIRVAVENPMVFYTAPQSAWSVVDWLTDKAALQDNDLWGGVSNVKTKYDPCPEGWAVPESGDLWSFRKEYKKTGNLNDNGKYDPSRPWYIEYDDEYCIGFRYKQSDGKEYWFPFSGNRQSNSGELYGIGGSGDCWTRNVSATTALMQIFAWGNPASESTLNRPYGASIRCVKEAK